MYRLFMIFKNDYFKSSATLASNSSPLKFFATIMPFSSNKNVAGIDSTAYSLAISSSQYFRLDTCNQVNLSSAIALVQASFSRSKETPITLNPLSLNLLYKATTCGFSRRHGPHQAAQKS